ncbi:MAG: NUDIX hydrolase [Verrucomicrobiae bacterium]|nr:NUDIX hydrolase [Verrucomicrobiae bacterium]
MIQPWPVQHSKFLGNFRVFNLHAETKTSPLDGREHEFIVLQCPDWVNVVAVTPDDQILLVEQFRHGSKTIEWEIPGGVMDPSDSSPLAAGLRELREETGYEGEQARIIGQVFPNPAIMTNTCHTILVERCHPRHPTRFDPCEDLRTHLVPVAEIPALVAAGRIRHSLVVAALFHYELYRRGQAGPH